MTSTTNAKNTAAADVAAVLADVVKPAAKRAAKRTTKSTPTQSSSDAQTAREKAAAAKRTTKRAPAVVVVEPEPVESTRAKPKSQYVVLARRSRVSGTMVNILWLGHADSEHAPKGDKSWALRCVDHNQIAHFPTRATAHKVGAYADQWCPTCKKVTAKAAAAEARKSDDGGSSAAPTATRRRK